VTTITLEGKKKLTAGTLFKAGKLVLDHDVHDLVAKNREEKEKLDEVSQCVTWFVVSSLDTYCSSITSSSSSVSVVSAVLLISSCTPSSAHSFTFSLHHFSQ